MQKGIQLFHYGNVSNVNDIGGRLLLDNSIKNVSSINPQFNNFFNSMHFTPKNETEIQQWGNRIYSRIQKSPIVRLKRNKRDSGKKTEIVSTINKHPTLQYEFMIEASKEHGKYCRTVAIAISNHHLLMASNDDALIGVQWCFSYGQSKKIDCLSSARITTYYMSNYTANLEVLYFKERLPSLVIELADPVSDLDSEATRILKEDMICNDKSNLYTTFIVNSESKLRGLCLNNEFISLEGADVSEFLKEIIKEPVNDVSVNYDFGNDGKKVPLHYLESPMEMCLIEKKNKTIGSIANCTISHLRNNFISRIIRVSFNLMASIKNYFSMP